MNSKANKMEDLLSQLHSAAEAGDWPNVRKADRLIVAQYKALTRQCTKSQQDALSQHVKKNYSAALTILKEKMNSAHTSLVKLRQSKEGMVAYSGTQEFLR